MKKIQNLMLRFLSALLICTTLSVTTAFGQSLSLVKKPDNSYVIEAEAPVNEPHALQASANLHLWVDLQEEIQGNYSYTLDTNRVTQRYFRLKPSVPPADPIRVLLIGDSMASDCCGWGEGMSGYFKENVTFVNYATPLYSTKIFMQSEEWEKMLLIRPNYVLIQFAWVDNSNDPDRSTTSAEFTANLRTIANTVRSFNGIPIFVTLHAARSFNEEGKLVAPSLRRELTQEVAAELDAPLIDLYQLSFDLFNELGPVGVEFMLYDPETPDDVMHLSDLGSVWISQLVARELPDALGPYLTKILDPPPQPE